MKNILITIFLFPIAVIAQRSDAALLKLLQGYEQQLADAVALGDTNVFKKYLHDSAADYLNVSVATE